MAQATFPSSKRWRPRRSWIRCVRQMGSATLGQAHRVRGLCRSPDPLIRRRVCLRSFVYILLSNVCRYQLRRGAVSQKAALSPNGMLS